MNRVIIKIHRPKAKGVSARLRAKEIAKIVVVNIVRDIYKIRN